MCATGGSTRASAGGTGGSSGDGASVGEAGADGTDVLEGPVVMGPVMVPPPPL